MILFPGKERLISTTVARYDDHAATASVALVSFLDPLPDSNPNTGCDACQKSTDNEAFLVPRAKVELLFLMSGL
jgi:hypothetical protein